MDVILVSWGFRDRAELKALGKAVIVDTREALSAYLWDQSKNRTDLIQVRVPLLYEKGRRTMRQAYQTTAHLKMVIV